MDFSQAVNRNENDCSMINGELGYNVEYSNANEMIADILDTHILYII